MIDAVSSAFHILEELVGSNGPRGVTDIAIATGIPKARVHRHLVALTGLNYVEQVRDTAKYQATSRLFLLGQMTADRLPWLIAMRTLLGLLRDKIGHSLVLSVIEEDHVRVIENFRGDAVVDISSQAGAILPLHASAQGKILLAFGKTDILDNCLSKPLKRFTPRTIVGADNLRDEIEKVRNRGWATSDEEIEVGFRIIAAPIFGADGDLAFTLGVIARKETLSMEADSPEILTALAASADLSKLLGKRSGSSG
ncbi:MULTISPECIES: IclR family transcriptional regulator [Mesorhizobium]|uniref:IclR family transcriptional regulator n=1 Tax=Mesorhizobium TaxID=68287 RepID=UPI0010A96267|nr:MULTISPECIES: IclR family transcriptional regulator [Mesorhizobium]